MTSWMVLANPVRALGVRPISQLFIVAVDSIATVGVPLVPAPASETTVAGVPAGSLVVGLNVVVELSAGPDHVAGGLATSGPWGLRQYMRALVAPPSWAGSGVA